MEFNGITSESIEIDDLDDLEDATATVSKDEYRITGTAPSGEEVTLRFDLVPGYDYTFPIELSETDRQDGVCPECGTDWYQVMAYDETMKKENINYCPTCGCDLD